MKKIKTLFTILFPLIRIMQLAFGWIGSFLLIIYGILTTHFGDSVSIWILKSNDPISMFFRGFEVDIATKFNEILGVLPVIIKQWVSLQLFTTSMLYSALSHNAIIFIILIIVCVLVTKGKFRKLKGFKPVISESQVKPAYSAFQSSSEIEIPQEKEEDIPEPEEKVTSVIRKPSKTKVNSTKKDVKDIFENTITDHHRIDPDSVKTKKE